jgi:transglutaminase-like putative cysteine protease
MRTLKSAVLATALVCTSTSASAAQKGAVPVKQASFEAKQEFTFTVADGAKKVRAWLTMPQEDRNQTVKDLKIDSPYPYRIEKDADGNSFVYVEVDNPPKEFKVVETFGITRREQRSGVDPKKTRPYTAEEQKRLAKYLGANANVIINDDIKKLAAEITGGEKNPVLAARKLYDWTLNNVDYWVKYPDKLKASGIGSTEYCLKNRTGNCTDFHSLWASLARASGIPTQIVYGSFFKKELAGQDKDQSYHCWPEFYVPNEGWVPHDVAIADIFVGDFATTKDNDEKVRLTTGDGYKGADKAKVEYYFGNIDERRVTWSRGRDLTLTPKQDAGPVNSVAKAYVEVDGASIADGKGWARKLTFTEK